MVSYDVDPHILLRGVIQIIDSPSSDYLFKIFIENRASSTQSTRSILFLTFKTRFGEFFVCVQ